MRYKFIIFKMISCRQRFRGETGFPKNSRYFFHCIGDCVLVSSRRHPSLLSSSPSHGDKYRGETVIADQTAGGKFLKKQQLSILEYSDPYIIVQGNQKTVEQLFPQKIIVRSPEFADCFANLEDGKFAYSNYQREGLKILQISSNGKIQRPASLAFNPYAEPSFQQQSYFTMQILPNTMKNQLLLFYSNSLESLYPLGFCLFDLELQKVDFRKEKPRRLTLCANSLLHSSDCVVTGLLDIVDNASQLVLYDLRAKNVVSILDNSWVGYQGHPSWLPSYSILKKFDNWSLLTVWGSPLLKHSEIVLIDIRRPLSKTRVNQTLSFPNMVHSFSGGPIWSISNCYSGYRFVGNQLSCYQLLR